MSQFSSALSEICDEFAVECTRETAEDVADVARSIAADLRSTSPRRSGGYASGWRVSYRAMGDGFSAIIYNNKKPGLAHLLEMGHMMRSGKRARAIPHIAPAFERGAAELERRLDV